jgi:hypothetical protein
MNKPTTTHHTPRGHDPRREVGHGPKKPRQPIKWPAPTPLERTSVSLESQPSRHETSISASLEAALDPRHRTCSPDWSIKYSGMSRAPGSKANPHHADPLTPPGNHISTLFDRPALCGHPRHCVGRPVSFHDTVPPTLVPPSHRPHRKRMAAPSKEVRSPIPHPPGTMP